MKRTCSKCNIPKDMDDFPKDSSQPLGRGYCCSLCVSERNKKKRRTKKKVYAMPRWNNHPENSPEDYITTVCPLCDIIFFPVKKAHYYCDKCSPIASHIYWALSSNTTGWGSKRKAAKRSVIPTTEMIKIARRFIQSVGCCYCKQQYSDDNPKSFDHIIPRCNGGLTTNDNISICCMRCNRSKGGLSLTDWIKHSRLIAIIDLP